MFGQGRESPFSEKEHLIRVWALLECDPKINCWGCYVNNFVIFWQKIKNIRKLIAVRGPIGSVKGANNEKLLLLSLVLEEQLPHAVFYAYKFSEEIKRWPSVEK